MEVLDSEQIYLPLKVFYYGVFESINSPFQVQKNQRAIEAARGELRRGSLLLLWQNPNSEAMNHCSESLPCSTPLLKILRKDLLNTMQVQVLPSPF